MSRSMWLRHTSAGDAYVDIHPNLSDFGRELTRGIGPSLSRAGQQMSRTGMMMTRGITVPLIGIAAAAVKTSIDFTKTMNTMGAVAGIPAPQLEKLRALAIDLGAKTVFSANEAAAAMLELGKAGVSTADIMGGGLANTLTLATAGDLELADAARIAANSMNIFGLSGKDSKEIVDALAGAANASSAGVYDLAEAMSNGGTVAHQLGMSVQETAAAMAAFADQGVIGGEAGTGFKSMMLALATPTSTQTALTKKLGLSFFDAQGEFVGLAKMSGQLKKKLGDLTTEQRTQALATIFGNYGQRQATILMGEGEKGIRKYIEATSEMGAAQKVAESKMKGLPGAVERLKGSLETAALVLGDALAPTIKDVAETIGNLLEKFTNLDKGTQQTIIKWAAILAVMGPTLLVVGKMVSGFGLLIKVVGGVISLIGGAIAVFNGLAIMAGLAGVSITTLITGAMAGMASAVGAFLMNPITLAVIAIGVAVYLIIKHWDTIKAALVAAWDWIKGAASAAWNWVKEVFGKVFTPIIDMWKAQWALITGVLTAVWDFIKGIAARVWNSEIVQEFVKTGRAIWQNITGMWNGIKNFLTTVWNGVKTVATAVWGGLVSWFKMNFNAIKSVFTSVWNGIKSFITPVWNAMKAMATAVFNGIKVIITTAWNIIKTITGAVWGSISGVIKAAWGVIKSIVTAAWQVVQGIIVAGLRILRGDWSGAWEAIKSKLSNAAGQIQTSVRTFLGRVVQFFQELPGRVMGALGDIGSLLVQAGSDLVQGLWNGIQDAWDGFIDWIVGRVSALPGVVKKILGISSPSKVFYDIGRNIVEGLDRGLENLGKVVERFQKVLNDQVDAIKDRLAKALDNDKLNATQKAAMRELAQSQIAELKRIAQAHAQTAKDLDREWTKLQAKYERIRQQAESFGESIRGGFSGFTDIVGGFNTAMGDAAQKLLDSEGRLTDAIATQTSAIEALDAARAGAADRATTALLDERDALRQLAKAEADLDAARAEGGEVEAAEDAVTRAQMRASEAASARADSAAAEAKAVEALADATTKRTAAQTELDRLRTATDPTGIAESVLNTQRDAAQKFGNTLQKLGEAGLSQDLIAQIAAAGIEAMPLAETLLKGRLSEVANKAMKGITDTQESITRNLTDIFFGDEMEAARGNIDAFANKVDEFVENVRADAVKAGSDKVIAGLGGLETALDKMVDALDDMSDEARRSGRDDDRSGGGSSGGGGGGGGGTSGRTTIGQANQQSRAGAYFSGGSGYRRL